MIGDSSADRVKENGGAEPLFSVEVPTEQVRPGDRVLVLPGESLPVDVSPSMFVCCQQVSREPLSCEALA